jgi:hypothetical protein
MVLLAAGRRRPDGGTAPVLFLGALVLNMLLLSPAGHAHYLVLLAPLLMAILATSWEKTASARGAAWVTSLIVLNPLASGLPLLPGLGWLNDIGIAMYAGLLIWLTAVVLLWKYRPVPVRMPIRQPLLPASAA